MGSEMCIRDRHLTDGAWVDVRPGWLTGSEQLCAELVTTVPWQAERRRMYDRMVDTPRLLRFYGPGAALPHPVLREAREALTAHYAAEAGAPPFTKSTVAGLFSLCFKQRSFARPTRAP